MQPTVKNLFIQQIDEGSDRKQKERLRDLDNNVPRATPAAYLVTTAFLTISQTYDVKRRNLDHEKQLHATLVTLSIAMLIAEIAKERRCPPRYVLLLFYVLEKLSRCALMSGKTGVGPTKNSQEFLSR
jgi:hypothetical protein